MAASKRLTSQQETEVVRRWLAGELQAALAKEYGTCNATIANTVSRRLTPEQKQKRWHRITNATLPAAMERVLRGEPVNQVAADYGIRRSSLVRTIGRHLSRDEYRALKKKIRTRPPNRKFTPEIDARIVAQCLGGESYKRVARAFGIGRNGVVTRIKEHREREEAIAAEQRRLEYAQRVEQMKVEHQTMKLASWRTDRILHDPTIERQRQVSAARLFCSRHPGQLQLVSKVISLQNVKLQCGCSRAINFGFIPENASNAKKDHTRDQAR